MGDISIIARRLADGHVQYGWSGNGGCFCVVGARLLAWYKDPELVEYLFGLGQLRRLGKPHSENGLDADDDWFFETIRDGMPHYLGTTEREIFSRIAFIDYGYFYDTDGEWYYVVPGPMRIKMPLELIGNHLDEKFYEYDFIRETEHRVAKYMATEYHDSDPEFREYLAEHLSDVDEFLQKTRDESNPLSVYDIYKNYRQVFAYFDDWVLVCANEDRTEITDIVLRPKMEEREETILWEKDENVLRGLK